MMFQYIVVSMTVLASIRASNAQCTETEQVAFVLALPNGLQCGLGLQAANSTPTVEGLDLICTESCAGAVSAWLDGPTCNDTSSSAVLETWCQPADGGRISRCRFIDENLFLNANITQCILFDTNDPGCPNSMCASGLQNVAEEIGCCYQLIYNNTMAFDGLQQTMRINARGRRLFENLRQQILWNACNVQFPANCISPTFQMDPPEPSSGITMNYSSTPKAAMDTTTASGIKINLSNTVIILSYLCAFA